MEVKHALFIKKTRKLKLISGKGKFFSGRMYHRETKQFSKIISLSLIFNRRVGPPNCRYVYGRTFHLISLDDITRIYVRTFHLISLDDIVRIYGRTFHLISLDDIARIYGRMFHLISLDDIARIYSRTFHLISLDDIARIYGCTFHLISLDDITRKLNFKQNQMKASILSLSFKIFYLFSYFTCSIFHLYKKKRSAI